MYCKVHPPVKTLGVCNNRGSCSSLVKYLSKESGEGLPYYDNFFSQGTEFVSGREVMQHIDSNHRTLKANADKFYMLTINPSQDEIRSVVLKVTGKKINDLEELSVDEREKVIQEMKNYARCCMDEYAKNFYRPKIKDGNDLVWYGRVETTRHYKSSDNKVKEGLAKVGDRKPGLQLHVHVVVSRMDRSQTVSLSPLSKSRGNRQVVNGHESIVGFDRSEWANRCARQFGSLYDHVPFYIKNRKEFEDWKGRNRVSAMAVTRLKRAVLHGELHYESKMVLSFIRTYRFIVNPRFVFLQECKARAPKLIKGKGL